MHWEDLEEYQVGRSGGGLWAQVGLPEAGGMSGKTLA